MTFRLFVSIVVLFVMFALRSNMVHAHPLAYVTNQGSGNVSVIDTATHDVVATIPTQGGPVRIVVSADGRRAYVVNSTGNSVSALDLVNNVALKHIPVGVSPISVDMSHDEKKVYVNNYGGASVSVIDTETNTLIVTIPVGTDPKTLVVAPDGQKVYVLNEGTNDLSVIEVATDTVIGTIEVGDNPRGIIFSKDERMMYIANNGALSGDTLDVPVDSVSVVDLALDQVVATIDVGDAPRGMALTPDGNQLYVVNSRSSNVSIIDTQTNKVIATVPLVVSSTQPSISWDVVIAADGKKAYVSNAVYNNVSVIDTASLEVITVPVGIAPFWIRITPDQRHVYVTNPNSGTISVIETTTSLVIETITTGTSPWEIEIVDPDVTAPIWSTTMPLTGLFVDPASIALTWLVATDDGLVTGYVVYRDGREINTGSTLSMTDSELISGRTYCYTVRAMDVSGNLSSDSNEVCITTPADQASPLAPTNLSSMISGTMVVLNWDEAVGDVEVVSYHVYRGEEVDPIGESIVTSFTDSTVVPGTTYTYRVTALDTAGNESGLSLSVAVLTPSVSGETGGGESSQSSEWWRKGCFIATAAYGSEMEPHVQLLRDFRDRYLLPSLWGKRFVATYYHYSPPIADVIRGHEGLRSAVRWMLWPFVAWAWFFLKVSTEVKLVMGMVLVGAMITSFFSKKVIT